MAPSLSDGEIYYRLRCLEENGDISASLYKEEMLSECKGRAYDHLKNHLEIRQALDDIMEFRGLRSGLQLGNIDKILATNCDEMIVNYLKWVHKAWNHITLSEEAVKCHVDDDTVRLFEFRVPCADSEDRRIISFTMNTGISFSGIENEDTRSKIKASIFSLGRVIPSLATFHENMNYISIGAKVLKTHLDIPPAKESKFKPRTTTLYGRLVKSWDQNCQPFVEVDEGNFLPLVGKSSSWIAFEQLFLSVLRQFPKLSSVEPLRDFRWEAMPAGPSARYLRLLFQRASILGFSNEKIENGLSGPISDVRVPDFKSRIQEPISNWRGGKPFVRTLLALQKISFLPILGKRSAYGPTVEFVYRDLINAFFKKQPLNLDHTVPGVSIDEVCSPMKSFPTVQRDDSRIEAALHASDTAVQDEQIGMEVWESDIDMATGSFPESPQMEARTMERMVLKRKRYLKNRNMRQLKQLLGLKDSQRAIEFQQLADVVSQKGRKTNHRKKSRPNQRLIKDIAKASRKREELQNIKRHTRLRQKAFRSVAHPPLAIASTTVDEDPPLRSPMSSPNQLKISQNSGESGALIFHPDAHYESEDSALGGGNRPQTPSESGSSAISVLELPLHDLGSETGPSPMATHLYFPQGQEVRATDQILSIAHPVNDDPELPLTIDSAPRMTDGTITTVKPPICLDYIDDRQHAGLPASESEAGNGNLEAPDEGSRTTSSSTSWTDAFPIVDETEASLHRNTSIGELIVTDEVHQNERKRKRQSDPKYADGGTQEGGGGGENHLGREFFIHQPRRILPLTKRRVEREMTQRQPDLKGTEGETEVAGEENQVGREFFIHRPRRIPPLTKRRVEGERRSKRQYNMTNADRGAQRSERNHEVHIREAQSVLPQKKRRRMETDLHRSTDIGEGGHAAPLLQQPQALQALGGDQGIATEDLVEIALTPAETLNFHYAE